MLKASQELFKFPIRLYDPIEIEYEDYISEMKSSPPERDEKEYVVGWKRVFIDTITEWNSCFTKGKTLEEVKQRGMDITIVTVGGDGYICDWSIEQFEKEYDRHCKKLVKHYRTLEEDQFMEGLLTTEVIKELQTKNKQDV